MTLGNISRGAQAKPFRVLVYGVEGVGKTSFAAGAPDPIFICSEDGTAQLDVARFPAPNSWADLLEAMRVLTHEEHAFKTVVVDTIDWLEPLCWAHVCSMGGKANIEDFGFGKGYVAAIDHWRQLLARLDVLARVKAMHVVLVAHAAIRRVDDPYTGPFDRYRMKVHERAGDLLREWVDAVLFARHEVHTVEKKGRIRGVSSGARILHTQWTAAYDAKNRFNLPEQLPLDWQEFESAARTDRVPSEGLRLELDEAIAVLPEADRAKAEKARDEWAGQSGARFAQLLDKVRAKVALLEEATATAPAEQEAPETAAPVESTPAPAATEALPVPVPAPTPRDAWHDGPPDTADSVRAELLALRPRLPSETARQWFDAKMHERRASVGGLKALLEQVEAKLAAPPGTDAPAEPTPAPPAVAEAPAVVELVPTETTRAAFERRLLAATSPIAADAVLNEAKEAFDRGELTKIDMGALRSAHKRQIVALEAAARDTEEAESASLRDGFVAQIAAALDDTAVNRIVISANERHQAGVLTKVDLVLVRAKADERREEIRRAKHFDRDAAEGQ